MSDIPGQIVDWLKYVGGEVPSTQSQGVPESKLMAKAALCYARASWGADACRLYEELRDWKRVAPYYEQQGRWEAAALCYENLADWTNAARCFQQCQDFNRAAECLVQAGQVLAGAWLWADLARQFHRAEYTAQQFGKQGEIEHLEVELILVRCEVGLGAKRAGLRLRRVVERQGFRENFQVGRIRQWALRCADVLERPDLAVLIHAVGVDTGVPMAWEEWEKWAIDVLGDASAVPQSERSISVWGV